MLTCHEENSRVIKETLIDFEYSLKKISIKCVLPSKLVASAKLLYRFKNSYNSQLNVI